MKTLSKLLTCLLVITIFANTITFVLGIFYFFDFETFGMWIMELVVIFILTYAKANVDCYVDQYKPQESKTRRSRK
ncbi:hypothetical protein [Ligilactobacillus salivarius]|uniref:Uncharacterized protein n=1 Tax=Ligilactobacillus salivarius TaxID=1624 RepID=A0A1D7TSS4_9LACO|nr:hypothetical protein [Ligilactobacillus salivarius]AOO74006.1 hypothetical protein BHF65_07180 [Ligilactobacillus salivarius]UDE97930.1 hypothetical protein LG631_03740 [Ligilactobacillus salivarius]UUV97047.1 hypothetical protein M3M92_03740 [Ligilactobacillus salivarius]